MKTKNTFFLAIFLGFFVITNQAQTESKQPNPNKFNHFSMGFQLCEYQKDFGIGIHFTSPYIIKRMAFRLRANLQFVEPTWAPYGQVTLSFVNRYPVIKDKLYVYSEGGGGIIIANRGVSPDAVYGSGFGLFGVEFHPISPLGFYFEMGGIGTAARTATGYSYSNGFILHSGMRFYF